MPVSYTHLDVYKRQQLARATPRHCLDSERFSHGLLLLGVAVPFGERFKQRCSSFVRRVKIASPAGYLRPVSYTHLDVYKRQPLFDRCPDGQDYRSTYHGRVMLRSLIV